MDGKEVVQLVDDAAVKSLIDNFNAEKAAAKERGENYQVLVDADHSSETGDTTKAMAWIDRIFDDPDRGLVGVFVFTKDVYGFRAVMKIESLTSICGSGLRAALVPVNALGVAARTIPVLNANLYTEVGTVSDDKSGLVIQFRRGGDWKTDKSTRASGGPVRVETAPADENRAHRLGGDHRRFGDGRDRPDRRLMPQGAKLN